MQQLTIDLDERSYEIVIGSNLIEQSSCFENLNLSIHHAVIITNETVNPLYERKFRKSLETYFTKVQTVTLLDGEKYKSWESLNTIFTELLESGADRKTTLFALGGGVIGDMTGFAAACYMRGVPYVQVPTTLLAQVDSSVGGKTAINHPLGKNMVGAFYQPQHVIADISTLNTLPKRELIAGLAEVIKYGPIYDHDFLTWIDQNLESLLNLETPAITHAIYRSCQIKAEVVAQDEREGGLRAILNFGHTFGHAIESGVGYGVWLHGEAVGCGMVMAADLSVRMGLLAAQDYEYLKDVILRAGLPIIAPSLGAERYMKLMLNDKKTEAGEIRFVLLKSLGEAVIQPAPVELVLEVLNAHQQV